jgi:arylsulfatase A-like enzyme
MYEGGTRVCQIARWPGRTPEGVTCDVPVTSTDFYPTFLEAAGLPPRPEQHCDGVSILPLLTGAAALERDAIFWHYPHYSNQGGRPGASVRSGRWKLIRFFDDERLELYDLESDPGEQTDLAGREPDRTAALKARLDEWMKDVGAKIPEPNPGYPAFLEEIRKRGWDEAGL